MPQDLPHLIPPPQPSVVPAYLYHGSQTYQDPVLDLGFSDFLTAIPGMSYAIPPQNWQSSSICGVSDFFGNPVQPFKQAAVTPIDPAPAPRPHPIQTTPVYAAPAPNHLATPTEQLSDELVVRTVPQLSFPSNISYSNTGPFRQSLWQLETEQQAHMLPLQTSQFKK
jgi:ubiquitin thioesterase protein OTUB1